MNHASNSKNVSCVHNIHLPEDVWSLILDHFQKMYSCHLLIPLRLTSKKNYSRVESLLSNVKEDPLIMIMECVKNGSLKLLKWSLRIFFTHRNTIQYCEEEDYSNRIKYFWGERLCIIAASNGHFEILKWLKKKKMLFGFVGMS